VTPEAGRPAGWGEPVDRAVLCFIVRAADVLLIDKKRGLGAGKVNAPGGRIEPGETPEQAAVRETGEEIGVTPLGLRRCGVLWFRFTDGYSLHCIVFRASGLEGEPIETDEAKPFWAPIERLPFDRMWADDAHWLPHVIRGETFEAWFDFDGERMLDGQVVVGDGTAPVPKP